MTTEELLHEAIEYLDYIGWGRDSWERECYEDTRKKLQEWAQVHPNPSDTK